MKIFSFCILILMLCCCQLQAQSPIKTPADKSSGRLNFRNQAIYGELNLEKNTVARHVNLIGGGHIDASYLGEDIFGFFNDAPDLKVYIQSPSANLSFYFTADDPREDPIIIVSDINGRIFFNDDASPEDLFPGVNLQNAQSGWYNVWVGAHEREIFIEGRLRVSAEWAKPGPVAITLDATNAPLLGSFSFCAESAPLILELVAGGDKSFELNSPEDLCKGFTNKRPAAKISWQGKPCVLVVEFQADHSYEDAVIMMYDPEQGWICNDDHSSGTLDPRVLFQATPGEIYSIWVGGHEDNKLIKGNLVIKVKSEI
jgi:hypothetical protein